MPLTFRDIQNAVIANGFNEGDRANVKTWIQFRHAWLWDAEEWTFRQGTATVTFTANSPDVAGLPTDFNAAVVLYNQNGDPVRPIKDFREFYNLYNPNLPTVTGPPEAFTVLDGQIVVGPNGDGSTGFLVYDKSKPTLSADDDMTGLPDGYDLALVHGGKAEGFKLTNIPLAQNFDDDFTAAVNALRRNYLTGIRAAGSRQLGAYWAGR